MISPQSSFKGLKGTIVYLACPLFLKGNSLAITTLVPLPSMQTSYSIIPVGLVQYRTFQITLDYLQYNWKNKKMAFSAKKNN